MTRPCAICHNTNNTTRICEECRAKAENHGWRKTPRQERSAFELSENTTSPGLSIERRREPYATDRCIEIVKRWLLGASQKQVAKQMKCSRVYVFKTISYWKRHRAQTLAMIIGVTDSEWAL